MLSSAVAINGEVHEEMVLICFAGLLQGYMCHCGFLLSLS